MISQRRKARKGKAKDMFKVKLKKSTRTAVHDNRQVD